MYGYYIYKNKTDSKPIGYFESIEKMNNADALRLYNSSNNTNHKKATRA